MELPMKVRTAFIVLILITTAKTHSSSLENHEYPPIRHTVPTEMREFPGLDSLSMHQADSLRNLLISNPKGGFARDSTIDSAYGRLQTILPAARRLGALDSLFVLFHETPAFEKGRITDDQLSAFRKKWVADARKCEDEIIRMHYSGFFNYSGLGKLGKRMLHPAWLGGMESQVGLQDPPTK